MIQLSLINIHIQYTPLSPPIKQGSSNAIASICIMYIYWPDKYFNLANLSKN